MKAGQVTMYPILDTRASNIHTGQTGINPLRTACMYPILQPTKYAKHCTKEYTEGPVSLLAYHYASHFVMGYE
jgi:hypothetical protein